MAFGTRAGLFVHASTASLPEATTTVTPSLMRALTATSIDASADELRLMLATAGLVPVWSAMTQLMPEMIADTVVEPLHPNTRTGTSVAAFATP